MYELKLRLEDFGRIAFEGDSMTDRSKTRWPFLRMMNWDLSWADIFEETVFCWRPWVNVAFNNLAVSGSNIDNMIGRLDSLKEFSPGLVMYTGGNNDCAQGIDLESFEEKTRKYIDEVNSIKDAVTGKSAKALMIGGFTVYEDPAGDEGLKQAAEYNKKKHPYYAVMKQVAEETGNYYVNINEGMKRSAEAIKAKHELHTIYSDGTHLNEVGARLLAGEILKIFGVITE